MRILGAICIGFAVLAVASILSLFVLPTEMSGPLAFAYCALALVCALGFALWRSLSVRRR